MNVENKNNNNNIFYVYIYWRLDINEVFYVGKGHGRRWKTLYKRNYHFTNIINKYPIAVEIVKDNLNESEAFYWEEYIINELVFKYGYSIDIKNNRSCEYGRNLVNCTWGGEGTSGMNAYENKTEEEMKEIGLKKRISKLGELNPMYGKTHTLEVKNKIKEVNSGKNNVKSKSVICLTTKRIFYTVTDGGRYYNCNIPHISEVCKGKRHYCGKYKGQKLAWRYLVWNHGKIYRIINN